MSDDDLRQALRSTADGVRGRRDDAGLERQLVRVDRIRTATRAGVAASIVAVVLGAVVLIGRSSEPTTVATSPEPAGPERVTPAPVGTGTTGTSPVTAVGPGSSLVPPDAPSSVPSSTAVPAPAPASGPTTATAVACTAAPASRSGASATVGFSGTAPPGTLARVEAKAGATGSAQVVVGPSGQWQLQITFVGATPNQPIEVWAGCPALGAKSVSTYTWTP